MIKKIILKYKVLKYIASLKKARAIEKRLSKKLYLSSVSINIEEKISCCCVDLEKLAQLFNKKILYKEHSDNYQKWYVDIHNVHFYMVKEKEITN